MPLSAFTDEVIKVAGLQKAAIDLRRKVVPDMPPGIDAAYIPAKRVAAQPRAQELAGGRSKLIVERPLEEWRAMMVAKMPNHAGNTELIDRSAKAYQQSLRRHELTHYLRDKAGKLPDLDKPGFRNTLKLLREEGIANLQGIKPFAKFGPKVEFEAAQGVIPVAVQSTRAAYGPLRRAMLSGTLKPFLPMAEKLKLVR